MLKIIFEEYKLIIKYLLLVLIMYLIILLLFLNSLLYVILTLVVNFFHQRCACHVLNLCVQNGLALLQKFIRPIRTSLFVKTSTSNEKLISFCQSCNMRPVKIARDVPTRWNSTYKLLC